ncbi:hypothetical protein E3P92_04055 [Wallemia ichthyophaga]|uniref:Phenylalanine--tRNA ligase, mitochondrial n=2 Tax=Wallemia ichthyophaga TaxID=245174 RepID=A0A4T0KLE9_WALIC|nr:hypothetical protein E3P91_02803 [Wallemia ichthyophaga]TIA77939.1 hypothetical protein E3P98_04038 [Wallemia ichthyophaga]TIA89400.1 hypothetical protein E3P97_03079 [Wallemia ichthyophaga]TIA94783.1 hypothetical protein E3P96_04023 [Wallemia ichthyophaga]TIA94789.1 hypothetical protein E3P95_04070 [Wallemia ichthyophaga]
MMKFKFKIKINPTRGFSTKINQDSFTNTPQSILSLTQRQLHKQPNHPIGILKSLIENSLPGYKHLTAPSPIVSTYKNFDQLEFPIDHPGRSLSDSYYLNKDTILRTHTSAHECDVFKSNTNKWLLTADVYRRDEIDSSHYPVFHQMEGACVWDDSNQNVESSIQDELNALHNSLTQSNIITHDETTLNNPNNPFQVSQRPSVAELTVKHLKLTLNLLVYNLFANIHHQHSSQPLQIRWIEAYFPWTGPSYELEVLWDGKWLELLGCGVMQQRTLQRADMPHKSGWAFGLGLERIAMVLFGIPDIRLFWSLDSRFLEQFEQGKITKFVPYSKYPPCIKDVSFWVDKPFHENDLYEIIREISQDLVESVECIDNFTHPKTNRHSLCYRINYRSMDKNLTNEQANEMHARIVHQLTQSFDIEIR